MSKKIGTRRQIVERYLLAHPGESIPQIREGIEKLTGILIERIQPRIDEINRFRVVTYDEDPFTNVRYYTLGDERNITKVFGVEVSVDLHVDDLRYKLRRHKKGMCDGVVHSVEWKIESAIERIVKKHWDDLSASAARAGHKVKPSVFRVPNPENVFDLFYVESDDDEEDEE